MDPELNTEDDDDEALVKPKKKEKETKPEPTHISLFMWLRVLLQQMQAEQLNRGAALRLMFETASIGALTPQLPVKADRNNVAGTTSLQVEYPQFQSICRTLFPNTPTVEIATLYTLCYEEGKRRVTADVFTKVTIETEFGLMHLSMCRQDMTTNSVLYLQFDRTDGRPEGPLL